MYDDLDLHGDLLTPDGPSGDEGTIRFQRMRDVGEVINVTFRFLRENMAEFGRALLVILGPVVLVGAILGFLWQRQFFASMGSFDGGDPANPFAMFEQIFTPAYFGVVIVGMVGPLLLVVLTYAYVALYRRGLQGQITPGVLWEEASPLLLPFLGYTLVFGLVMGVSAIVMIIPCLGALAWIVGYVYAMPILALTYVARATDQDGLKSSLSRVRMLIKGEWWATFGVMVIAAIIVFIAAIVLSLPGSIAGFGMGFNSLSGDAPASVNTGLLALSSLLGLLVYAAYPIPIVAMAFQYGNLTEQYEGTELQYRLDSLAETPPASPQSPPMRSREEPTDDGFGAWRDTPPASPDGTPDGSDRGFRGGGFDDEAGRG